MARSNSVLAGLTAGAGRKIAGHLSTQANGANHVHAIAVQGEYAARAQSKAHEHFIASSKHLHELSGGKGKVSLNVDSSGNHNAEWGGATTRTRTTKPKTAGEVAKGESKAPAKGAGSKADEVFVHKDHEGNFKGVTERHTGKTAEDIYREMKPGAKPEEKSPSASVPSQEAPADKPKRAAKPKATQPAEQPAPAAGAKKTRAAKSTNSLAVK